MPPFASDAETYQPAMPAGIHIMSRAKMVELFDCMARPFGPRWLAEEADETWLDSKRVFFREEGDSLRATKNDKKGAGSLNA